MKHIAILSLMILVFTACSSVPLATMWRLKDFSAKSVAFINPNDIRAKIVHTDSIEISSSNLDVGLINQDGSEDKHTFPFEIVDRKEETRGMFFKETVAVTTLKLSPQAVKDFERFKQTLQDAKQKNRRMKLSVAAHFTEFEDERMPDQFEFSILLKIDAKEDYFTLIDDTTIDLNIDPEMRKKMDEGNTNKAGANEN